MQLIKRAAYRTLYGAFLAVGVTAALTAVAAFFAGLVLPFFGHPWIGLGLVVSGFYVFGKLIGKPQ